MLPSSDLSWIRDYIDDNMLPGTAIITRDSAGTVNAFGEYVESTSAVGTVSCRIDPFNRVDSKGMVAERDVTKSYYRLTVPYDTDIAVNDVITISSTDYEVLQLHDNHSYNFTRRAVLSLVE